MAAGAGGLVSFSGTMVTLTALAACNVTSLCNVASLRVMLPACNLSLYEALCLTVHRPVRGDQLHCYDTGERDRDRYI